MASRILSLRSLHHPGSSLLDSVHFCSIGSLALLLPYDQIDFSQRKRFQFRPILFLCKADYETQPRIGPTFLFVRFPGVEDYGI